MVSGNVFDYVVYVLVKVEFTLDGTTEEFDVIGLVYRVWVHKRSNQYIICAKDVFPATFVA